MPVMCAPCLECRMTMNLRTEPTSEMQLVRQAQMGDKEAFARLYEAHKHRVYAICLRITRERAEAEDCAQEAFLQCFPETADVSR